MVEEDVFGSVILRKMHELPTEEAALKLSKL